MTLYHGTDSLDFRTFDMAHVGPFNVGLHFGSESAALSRIDYLRNESPDKPCRLLRCQVDIRNPLRVDDVFGRSYAGVVEGRR